MKIEYNQDGMSNSLKENVEHAMNTISSALDKSQNINMPSDFARKGDLYSTQSVLASVKSQLINYNYWINKLKNNFDRVEEECEKNISKLQKLEIERKSNLV